MTEPYSPKRWANDISSILTTVLGGERFPVDVISVAKEITQQKYPQDPITMIQGADLPGFEGALVPKPDGKAWGIIYNNAIISKGRINFTLAHEFGHYLLHRRTYPKGFQCSTEDMAQWDSTYRTLEHEANQFAATLLMPLNDFRKEIDSDHRPSLSELGNCADRYAVSLLAATLRWLGYTKRRSMLVVSRDGFILWARSSKSALKTGLYFRTRGVSPIEVPGDSLAAGLDTKSGNVPSSTAWLNTGCQEELLVSDQYGLSLSLLHFMGDGKREFDSIDDEDTVVDTYEKMTSGHF